MIKIILNIYNGAGVMQQTFMLESHNFRTNHDFDLSDLDEGIYFLKMIGERGTATFKIIKEK